MKFNFFKKDIDLTILLIGKNAAGKDIIINLLENDKFCSDHDTPLYYVQKIKIKNKLISIINTSGSEMALKNTEEASMLPHDIRCYVFDSRKYYSDESIKLEINYHISECKERNMKFLALGTRGNEINNKDMIENEIRNMGAECRIFEMSQKPREDLIKYLKII